MKCTHLDKEYDSITEACVGAWLAEAKAHGLIVDYYEQVEFLMSLGKTHHVEKQLKTKVKLVERTLLQPARYTADFVVCTENNAHASTAKLVEAGLLSAGVGGTCNTYSYVPECVFVVDVKGERQPATQASKFSLTQKFLHESNGVYVNKLIPCARKPRARSKSFFMLCGLPKDLPSICYLNDGSDYRQPWRDMFAGCPTIKEAFSEATD